MERLTERSAIGNYFYPKCFEKCDGNGSSEKCNDCEITTSICEKLGKYEDLEEQGRLIKLPCKVGDTVYVPTRNFISELQITEVVYNRDGTYLRWVLLSGIYPNLNGFVGRKIGNEVFLTKSEAEAKLKELRGGENERI